MPQGTRERLLDAAWACVSQGGMQAASSRAITSAAGANLAAITYHFGSKDTLLAEAFVTGIRRLVAPALTALQQEGVDPVTRLFGAISQLQESLAGSADEAPALLEILVQSRRMPVLGEQVGALFGEIRAALAVLMSDQQQVGALPSWVEPDAMAALLVAVALGVIVETTVEPAGPGQPAIATQFAQLLIAARRPPGADAAGGVHHVATTPPRHDRGV